MDGGERAFSWWVVRSMWPARSSVDASSRRLMARSSSSRRRRALESREARYQTVAETNTTDPSCHARTAGRTPPRAGTSAAASTEDCGTTRTLPARRRRRTSPWPGRSRAGSVCRAGICTPARCEKVHERRKGPHAAQPVDDHRQHGQVKNDLDPETLPGPHRSARAERGPAHQAEVRHVRTSRVPAAPAARGLQVEAGERQRRGSQYGKEPRIPSPAMASQRNEQNQAWFCSRISSSD